MQSYKKPLFAFLRKFTQTTNINDKSVRDRHNCIYICHVRRDIENGLYYQKISSIQQTDIHVQKCCDSQFG